MTDLDKIKEYYKNFNEWNRLDNYPGQLELKIVLELIKSYLPPNSKIFDIGGGAGRYTYELAKIGYQLDLADLSPDLIEIAKEKLKDFQNTGIVSTISVANALDLSHIAKEEVENIMLFGPLYHLTQENEIEKCIQECFRILKPKGKIFAAYIPYHCGLMSILERSFYAPEQVDDEKLLKVFEEGVFHNASPKGFQEGIYIKREDLLEHFEKTGFKTLELRSIRGFGYGKEKEIIELEYQNTSFYQTIMKILKDTSSDLPILETCGHAVFIGEKL